MVSVTMTDVYKARQVVARYQDRTPLFFSTGLSRRTDCEVYVKYENQSPIRSFKARGALYCVSRLQPGKAGVACASTGNHGQGMALAARLFGCRALVVAPRGTSEQKLAAMRNLGADLRVLGKNLAEASEIARQISGAENLTYVEDGEDPDVMAGCATLAQEVLEQLPDLQHLVVPVGGGNLLAACALVIKTLTPSAVLTGVQSVEAPAVYQSWRAGRPVRLEQCQTLAGGLATSYPGSLTFPYIRDGVDHMLVVSDGALLDAASVMLAETGQLPEAAGAAALAALLAEPTRYAGQKVVILLSGGNFEPAVWDKVLTAGRAL